MDTTVADSVVGRVLDGRYRVDARIARGGMATVYLGHDLRLDRPVAVKVMHPGLAEDHAFVERFIREARSAARLSHPNVVAVHDQGEDDGLVFLAMEYVPGRTVRDLLRERGRLSPAATLGLMEPVLAALAAAHRAGLIHRDVKPENILLGDDGSVKVADFGLARAASTGTAGQPTQGLLLGTVAYLAPEQLDGGTADRRSDVYAAGIVLYELLTGAPPFGGESAMAVAYQHVHGEVPPPSEAAPEVPPAVDGLVLAATARDPEHRPADAGELRSLAERVRAQLLADADRVDTEVVALPPTTQNRAATPAAAATGVAAAASTTTGTTTTLDVRPLLEPPPRLEPPTGPPGPGVPGHAVPAPSGHDPVPPGLAPTRRRGRRWFAWLAFALVAATVAYLGWWAGGLTSTPSVIGQSVAQAQTQLTADGFDSRVGEQRFSETAPTGQVLATDPSPGQRIRKGATVTLAVSKGPERFAVPALSGRTVAEAQTALADTRLALGAQSKAYSDTVPSGRIISTTPPAGELVRKDTAVRVVVSRGVQPVKVPAVTGRPLGQAQDALAAVGLKVAQGQKKYDEAVPAGGVVSQNPAAGATVPKGSTVTVVVSLGPPLVPVPSVFDQKADQARRVLEAAGFKVQFFEPFGASPLNRVISQSPGAGSQAPKGSTIRVGLF